MTIRQLLLVGLFAALVSGNLAAVAHATVEPPVVRLDCGESQTDSQKDDSRSAQILGSEELQDIGPLLWFDDVKGRLPWEPPKELLCGSADDLGPLA